ncbi:hypothetical protein LGM65_05645 [Burkholderia anthina]|uniref:hypothetical protein n=1 Tax=Burkholderia anthina TaxID=179879 RepID=UPI001CF24021|nr:hypothetical protein [Burkholderia anthina]MCA8090372.1 hypothetical protein [Burkholderia anthina]
MKTLDGTHVPMAAKASGATCVPVSHGVAFVAVKRSREPCRRADARGTPNKKTRERFVSRGFFDLRRIASGRSMVPGTGLEPASQSRRRIFVTLLLSKPASSERHRSCAGLCLRRRARA